MKKEKEEEKILKERKYKNKHILEKCEIEKCEIQPLGNLCAYRVCGSVAHNSEVKARDNRKISNFNKDSVRKLPFVCSWCPSAEPKAVSVPAGIQS